MKIWSIFLVLTALALPALADPEQTVRCREIGFSKSVENLNRNQFPMFIDPDARFVGIKVDRSREAIAEAWRVFFSEDAPLIKWRPQFVEVLESGDLALTRGPYRIIDKDESGQPTEGWGTFNSVWRLNDDGEWLVVFDAGSFPDETPTDEQRALLDAEDDCGN
jgi:ketosteroid isomerase-like protein